MRSLKISYICNVLSLPSLNWDKKHKTACLIAAVLMSSIGQPRQKVNLHKGIVKRYLMTMTGYSETQIDRLIARKKETGRVVVKERTQPTFPRVYTPADVVLLAEVDAAEQYRNGKATKKTITDMYEVYGDRRFERLAKISVSHLYNLRGTRIYQLEHTVNCGCPRFSSSFRS